VIQKGKTYYAGTGAKNVRRFKIYRWDPDSGENPRVDTYEVDLAACGPMVLDALIKIKNEIDPTLTFRRSCREGHLRFLRDEHRRHQYLACTKAIDDCVSGEVKIYPLPHMAVVKDLVPDLTHFYAQYASIKPWLQRRPAAGTGTAAVQGRPRQAGRPVRVHPVRLLLDQLPELLVEWRPLSRPAILLQAYRWIVDSRDEDTGERLDDLEDPFRLYRCHTIMNCTDQDLPEGSRS
jgi:succinate dehydrogenase / fumarate reductase iron-sulfur subunit